MNYYDFEVGNNTYKLRLNTRNTIALEKKLGCNPLGVFGDGNTLPTIEQMVTILWASLQQFNHNMNMEAVEDIFDRYLETHVLTDFFNVIIEVYKVSGLMPNAEEAEKN